MSDPPIPLFHRVGRYIMRTLMFLFSQTRVEGLEHVPPGGGLILVSNHLSYVDPPLLAAVIPRPPHFMAKEELWRTPVVRWMANNWGAFPVRRGAADRAALRHANRILDAGGVVGMFPEGTRSRDRRLHRANPGVALLALRAGVPLLPAAITGTPDVFRFLSGRTPVRARLKVRFGPTFRLSRPRIKGNAAQFEALADEIMTHVARLLPEANRGWYAAATAPQIGREEILV